MLRVITPSYEIKLKEVNVNKTVTVNSDDLITIEVLKELNSYNNRFEKIYKEGERKSIKWSAEKRGAGWAEGEAELIYIRDFFNKNKIDLGFIKINEWDANSRRTTNIYLITSYDISNMIEINLNDLKLFKGFKKKINEVMKEFEDVKLYSLNTVVTSCGYDYPNTEEVVDQIYF